MGKYDTFRKENITSSESFLGIQKKLNDRIILLLQFFMQKNPTIYNKRKTNL